MMNFLKDWIIQYQNKFSVGGVETTIDRITGTVSQEGDTIMASYLNEIQKNCIYQVSATRVIEGVLEIYDISIDGSEEFTPFNQTFLIDFSATNTQVDSLLRFNGITYSLRFSDSVENGDKAPSVGFIPKRAVVKLDVSNSKAIIIDDRTILQSLLDLKANLISPAFTGTPTAPTGTAGTNTNQIATTQFVTSNKQTAKAWVNFNGTGTVAIRSSYNVSSITDMGMGAYTVNFINNMSDTNYSTVGSVGRGSYAAVPEFGTTKTISGFSVESRELKNIVGDNRTPNDNSNIHALVFGD